MSWRLMAFTIRVVKISVDRLLPQEVWFLSRVRLTADFVHLIARQEPNCGKRDWKRMVMRRRLRSSGGRLASSLWLLLPVVADFSGRSVVFFPILSLLIASLKFHHRQ